MKKHPVRSWQPMLPARPLPNPNTRKLPDEMWKNDRYTATVYRNEEGRRECRFSR